jgi:hypothetical protein
MKAIAERQAELAKKEQATLRRKALAVRACAFARMSSDHRQSLPRGLEFGMAVSVHSLAPTCCSAGVIC